jgi:hypothetical protein
MLAVLMTTRPLITSIPSESSEPMYFAAMIHFRSGREPSSSSQNLVGGYGWFLGKADSLEGFQQSLQNELLEQNYWIENYDHIIELSSADDLTDPEHKELFELLEVYPIQFRTVHTYRHDDS